MSKRSVKENKKLVEEFPFLKPTNRWTGNETEDYDYHWTELDSMPEGWRKAFGLDLCRELKEALGDFANEYRILQIKEKFGGLRWYDNGNTEKGLEVIRKYEDISYGTCIVCGAKATKSPGGWISPFCDECYDDERYGSPLYSIADGKWTKLYDFDYDKKEWVKLENPEEYWKKLEEEEE